MAIKKGLFQDYAKNQELERQNRAERAKNSKYKHAKVFESDDKTTISQAVSRAVIKQELPIKDNTKTKDATINKKVVIKNKSQKDYSNENNTTKDFVIKNDFELNKFILNLSGHQKLLFLGLLSRAKNNTTRMIEKITMTELMSSTNTSYQNTKLAISRLVNKGLLIRGKGKTAKNGYYNLGFEEKIYNTAINLFGNLSFDVTKKHHEIELEVEN